MLGDYERENAQLLVVSFGKAHNLVVKGEHRVGNIGVFSTVECYNNTCVPYEGMALDTAIEPEILEIVATRHPRNSPVIV